MSARVEPLDPRELDALAPLWKALHDHHAALDPLAGLAAMEERGRSWELRRARYVAWLAEPGAFALVAREPGGGLAGYAVARVVDHEGSWRLGDRVGVLETLSVAPGARGRGVGAELLRAVRRRLAAAGVRHMTVDVVAANEDALRFYRRAGALPFVTVLVAPV